MTGRTYTYGGLLLVVCGGIGLLLLSVQQRILPIEDMETVALFEKGEYYFNHSEQDASSYDLEKARLYYTELIQRNPEGHPLAWYQLGRIDFIEGYFDDAIFKFEKQKVYFPDSGVNPDYLIGLSYGYRARSQGDASDWDQAAEAFIRFSDAVPGAVWARVDLAWVYFAQGKFEEMRPVVREGLKDNPENPWLHNMYGLAFLNTGKYEQAYNHFLEANLFVENVTVSDWGVAYPGNDPKYWEQGLFEFKQALEKNLQLAKTRLSSSE